MTPQDQRNNSVYVAQFMAALQYREVPPAYFDRLAALLVQNGVEVSYSEGTWRLNLWSPGSRRDRGPRIVAFVADRLREFCAVSEGLMQFPGVSAARIAQNHFDEMREAINAHGH